MTTRAREGHTFIYALVDPSNLRFRYVGKSDCPKTRLSACRGEANSKDLWNSKKSLWIRSLAPQRPLLITLEEVRLDESEDKERYWIERLTKEGYDLTNGKPGGDFAIKGRKARLCGGISLPAIMWDRLDKASRFISRNAIIEKVLIYLTNHDTRPRVE